MSRPEVRGRAVGAIVMALFALGWTSWGLSTGVCGSVQSWGVGFADVLTVGLVVVAVVLIRRASALPAGTNTEDAEDAGRRFGWVVGIEFAGLGLISVLLGRSGHQELIPTAVCLGVGLHFFPLARLFDVTLYYWTGSAMCLIGLLTVLLAGVRGSAGQDTVWTALPGLGSAVVLYLTSGRLLRVCAHALEP